jgi:hypothetical protein
MKPKKLWKTTIVIWSEWEPKTDDTADEQPYELEDLAHAATSGDAYCSKQVAVLVKDPSSDPDWDGTEFFDCDEGLDEEEPEEDDEPIHDIDSNNKWGSQ